MKTNGPLTGPLGSALDLVRGCNLPAAHSTFKRAVAFEIKIFSVPILIGRPEPLQGRYSQGVASVGSRIAVERAKGPVVR